MGGPMKFKPALLLGIPMLAAALLLGAPAHPASAGDRAGAGAPHGNNKIWNGYVYLTTKNGKPSSKVNLVRAWWIQPPATCHSGSLATDGIWVGLGGLGFGKKATSPLLVQAGTVTDCTLAGGYTTNGVWEIIPPGGQGQAVVLPSSHYPVTPGDLMFAVVDDMGGGHYSIVVQDESVGWEWSKTVSLRWKAEPYSGEWIVESGSNFGLANFGSVVFTNCAYDQNLTSLAKADKFVAGTPPQTTVWPIHYAPNDSHFLVTWRHS
jgi:Peptidase A4 family